MSTFASVFAPMMNAMLEYREALGYSRTTHSANLLAFDKHCLERNISEPILTEGLIWGHLNELEAKKRSGMNNKATTLRLLGKYLTAVGQESYILPDKMFAARKTEPPYIFTDGELIALFRAVDNLRPPCCGAETVMIPTLFRLIYTCGLRPNEGRELLTENINLDTGEVLITKTKRHKERIIVMSDDMLDFCKFYHDTSSRYRSNSKYFFPSHGGEPLINTRMNSLLNECWHLANPTAKDLPAIRVYDLRHRFASAILIRWIDERKNLYAMLPYLSAYMGHASLTETAHYIHILPENLTKSAGIDWEIFNDLLPEVDII